MIPPAWWHTHTHTHTYKSDPSVPETQDLQNCDIENLRLSSWAGPNVKVISWVQHPIDSYPFCSILLGPQLGITFAEIHSHIVDHREFQFISRSFHINRAIYSWYMAQRRPIHYVLIHGVQTNRPEFKIYIFFINHLHELFDNIFNHQMDLDGFGEMQSGHDYVHRRSVIRTNSQRNIRHTRWNQYTPSTSLERKV